ncbi:MAG: 16S rRNA (guanine(527)-N(7))-methyltransferase RsmG [Coriobacteriaceae bacterium]|nr:16S rRNA (guanine(527)-N(7))-methyltransferase RsmG [Coriobacteriaceae bacterium]
MFHVKHLGDIEQARNVIALGAAEMGVSLSDRQLSQVVAHLEAVLAAAGDFNLTTVREATPAARVHVLDSLAAAPYVEREAGGPIVDIGSGAGFPGIPLGIACERTVVLLESVRKKADFLRCVKEDLGLDAAVMGERAEEYGRREQARAPVAVARAVAALPVLVELARPLLTDSGVFLAYKGAPEREELERADLAAKICGFEPPAMVELDVPGLGARRTLVVFRVAGPPRIDLPRRTGLAQKRPLA